MNEQMSELIASGQVKASWLEAEERGSEWGKRERAFSADFRHLLQAPANFCLRLEPSHALGDLQTIKRVNERTATN